MTRIHVQPEMLRWACERAGYPPSHLADRIPQLLAWLRRLWRAIEKLAPTCLVDADVFITAKNLYHGFDLCPVAGPARGLIVQPRVRKAAVVSRLLR